MTDAFAAKLKKKRIPAKEMNPMTEKFFRLSARLGLFFLLSASSSAAMAVITHDGCPYRIIGDSPASIGFDPSLPNGSVLWTGVVELREAVTVYNCYGLPNPADLTKPPVPLIFSGIGSSVNSIYSTGIPGIGYRLHNDSRVCYQGYWPGSCLAAWPIGTFTIGLHSLRYELIKTGPISTGGQLSGTFASVARGPYINYTYEWSTPVVVRPTPPTCNVTTRAQTVQLGAIPVTTFTGHNSVSPSVPLTLALNCSGANLGATASVRVTLTDNTNPGNRGQSLSLSSASTAKGVAIQVLKGDTVLGYGPASNADDNPNQWYAGETSNGIFTIALKARYVQTESRVVGGSANGAMTFTMNYR